MQVSYFLHPWWDSQNSTKCISSKKFRTFNLELFLDVPFAIVLGKVLIEAISKQLLSQLGPHGVHPGRPARHRRVQICNTISPQRTKESLHSRAVTSLAEQRAKQLKDQQAKGFDNKKMVFERLPLKKLQICH